MTSLKILDKFLGGKWTKESILGFSSLVMLLIVIGFLPAIYIQILLSTTIEESTDLITYVVTLIPLILPIMIAKKKLHVLKYRTTGTNKKQQQHSGIDIESEQTEEHVHVAMVHVASTRFLETEV